jgi:aldehyde dehydrogenase (NAD+)
MSQTAAEPRTEAREILSALDLSDANLGGFAGTWTGSGDELDVVSPVDGRRLATVRMVTEAEYDEIVDRAHAAFLEWRKVPAPKRGEVVRQLGNALRAKRSRR